MKSINYIIIIGCFFVALHLSGQTGKISSRHTASALQHLDTFDGIPFLNPWDYQSHSAGFGKPGQNALPYVVKQAYRSFWLLAVPEPFQQGGVARYGPDLPNGKWGVFAENGKDIGAVFEVKDNQLHGSCTAYFSGALLRFLIPPFYYNQGDIDHFETYVVTGDYSNGNKVGSWQLKSPKSETIIEWSYDNLGKFQSTDSIFEQRHFKGLIRYQYVSENYQDIGQGFVKEMYTVYKNSPKGNLIRQGTYLKFHPTGYLQEEGFYEKGVKHGAWVQYDLEGNIFIEEHWENGTIVTK